MGEKIHVLIPSASPLVGVALRPPNFFQTRKGTNWCFRIAHSLRVCLHWYKKRSRSHTATMRKRATFPGRVMAHVFMFCMSYVTHVVVVRKHCNELDLHAEKKSDNFPHSPLLLIHPSSTASSPWRIRDRNFPLPSSQEWPRTFATFIRHSRLAPPRVFTKNYKKTSHQ